MGYLRENIQNLQPYVPGFQPDQPNAVKLNTNENPYPPSPGVIEAIKNFDPEKIRKYPQPFADQFRTAAAKTLGITTENIICTNGGDELLTIAVRAFCDSARPLAYPTPTYTLYKELAGIQNCPVIEIPFDDEYNLPAKLASTSAPLTIVCNPNAPTTTFIPVEELASLADELKGVLLIDEAYVDFAQNNCLELIKNFDNVIILRSMSKGYSLASLRFGFGIANPALINELMKVKDSYNVNAVSIAAAAAAISDQNYFNQNVQKIIQQRTWLTEKLKNLGFDIPQSSTNFLFVKCTQHDAQDIFLKLQEKNIYIRYWDYAEIDKYLRITIGTQQQNEILLEAIKNIIEK